MHAAARTVLVGALALAQAGTAWGVPPESDTTGRFLAVADGDLWLTDLQGATPRRLTSSPATAELRPAWSPDGNRIAYTRRQSIWVMDADGSDRHEIPTGSRPADVRRLLWSPDGAWLALATSGGIVVVRPDGTELRQVVDEPVLDADWAPDGESLVFSSDGTISRVDVDGTGLTPLASGGQAFGGDGTQAGPKYSPDGEWIAFGRPHPVTGSHQLAIVDPSGGTVRGLFSPVVIWRWMPDGARLVAYVGDGRRFLVDLDGDRTELTPLLPDGCTPWPTLDTARFHLACDADPDPFATDVVHSTSLLDGTDRRPVPLPDGFALPQPWHLPLVLQPRPCTIVGTPDPDVLTGTDGDDVICGEGGDDVIRAKAGDDVVLGGAGDDTILGGTGRDRIVGDAGADTIDGGAADDRLVATDLLAGDTVDGGTGARDSCDGDGADALTACEVDPSS